MHQYGMEEFVVHAPYIIDLANTVKPETFQLAVDFLTLEVQRTAAIEKSDSDPASGSTCRCRCGSRNSSDHQRVGMKCWRSPTDAISHWKRWQEKVAKSEEPLKKRARCYL